jgi:transaldolase
VTTNPSIFAKAISGGDAYAAQLGDLAARGVDPGEALRALTTLDVRWACDELREVYDRTGGQDGRVSIEVDPPLAHDTAATVADAQALWWAVLSRLDALGIDLDEALQKLEHDGVSTFEGAWSQLGEQLSSTLRSTARSGWAS